MDKNVNWLSLQQASTLMGVHPSTLRQWADSGKVYTVRTPGGHRRFAETDLLALLEPEQLQPGGIQLIMESAMGRIRMQISAGSIEEQLWYKHFDESTKADHRALGRDLMALVMRYLTNPQQKEQILAQTRELGESYGRRNRKRGLTRIEAVQGFQFFQHILLEGVVQLSQTMGGQSSIDLVGVHHQINNFNNQLLLAMLHAYED